MKEFQERQKKKVGFRTSKRFLRNVFRKNPAYQARGQQFSGQPIRSLGGHR